jgi:hypothetical protein
MAIDTTKDKTRGQVIAHADPRAYKDRLNAIFSVRGWTRKYAVEMINNVERMISHESKGKCLGKAAILAYTCCICLVIGEDPCSEKRKSS